MRVLVTGGAGFIGSHLCDRLLLSGAEVWCVDNLDTGSLSNLQQALEHKNFHFIRADVRDGLPALGIDRLYNMACPASPVAYQRDPIGTLRTCFIGMLNALELARSSGARLLQASTSEVYGDPQVHPQPEDYVGAVNCTGPRACYDEGKRAAEALCFDYHRQHGVEIRIPRIFNTYGPRMHADDGRVVPNFITRALEGDPLTIYGDGRQTRSFCFVEDMVDGLVKLMEAPGACVGPVNLGNPGEFQIRELADLVLAKTGSRSTLAFAPLPKDDPQVRRPQIDKALSLIDWSPRVTLDEGLDRSIAWYKSQTSPTPVAESVASPVQGVHAEAAPGMRRPTVSVVVPAYQAQATLRACLSAIAGQTLSVEEVIVFVDGATDETESLARAFGAKVLVGSDPAPRGPAFGRNRGAAVASGEVVAFVDADVILAPDALQRLVDELGDRDVAASFGSYDDSPQSRRTVSLYANLRHHYVHQHGDRDAQTFWSGIGVVRRDVFLAHDGFDADRFPHPSIEDVELGSRLTKAGHTIRMVPEAQGKHVKDWTLWRLWLTDVRRRAVPWTRLLAEGSPARETLNLAPGERTKAALALGALLATAAGLVAPPMLVVAAALLAAYVAANRRFLRFMWKHEPRLTALAGFVPLHLLYHAYAATTFAAVTTAVRLRAAFSAPKPAAS